MVGTYCIKESISELTDRTIQSKFTSNNQFTEPVGFKAPAFPSVATSFGISHEENSTVVLPCEAQAFPVPVFR